MKFQIIWNFFIFLANDSKYFGIFFQLFWKWFEIDSKLLGIFFIFLGNDSKYFGNDSNSFGNDSKYFGIFPTFLEMITNILEFFQLYWKRFVIYSKLFGNGSNFFGIDSEYFRIFTTFLELIPNCLEMIVISNDMKWCKMTWLNRFDIFWLDCEWFQIIWIPKWLELKMWDDDND